MEWNMEWNMELVVSSTIGMSNVGFLKDSNQPRNPHLTCLHVYLEVQQYS